MDAEDVFTTRFIQVVLAALSKLAARCQDLVPNVMVCLTKVRSPRCLASICLSVCDVCDVCDVCLSACL